MNEYGTPEQIHNKEVEYEEYIIEHKRNVIKATEQVINKLELSEEIAEELRHRATIHDLSKYSDEEFMAYRKYFHPVCDEERDSAKEEFEKAWEHHYLENSHHWNHYYNKETEQSTPMTIMDIYEMIADWTAMGYKFENDAYEYYEREKDKIFLHPETKSTLEELLLLMH